MVRLDDPGLESAIAGLDKAPTGIVSLDVITRSGLPWGRITLVAGDSGSGKTVLALETLVHGVHGYEEPGIFVAFEESPAHVLTQCAPSFRCDLGAFTSDELLMFDARLLARRRPGGRFRSRSLTRWSFR